MTTTTIKHHPDDSTLLSYAAGSLPGALAAVVCAHIAMCPRCAGEVSAMERVGAALFDALKPQPLSRAVPHIARRALEAHTGYLSGRAALEDGDIPLPLRAIAGARIDDLRWKRLGMGIWNVPLQLSNPGETDLRLLRVGPGRAMPEHGHGGTELTLILRGSYHDQVGDYYPGDVADLDEEVDHRPIAHAELGCICLIASERPARFKGLLGRIVQPLTGF